MRSTCWNTRGISSSVGVRAELYDFTVEHPAQHVLRWLDITDGVEDALGQLERVAYTVEGIILKHA